MIELLENVNSSMLEQVTYDNETKRLVVVFKNSKEYFYDNVPTEVWKQFQESESKGKFYTQNIKGKYPADIKEVEKIEETLKGEEGVSVENT